MIQKNTVIKPSDSCGILKSRVFHVYKGPKGRICYTGDFAKFSARLVKPDNPIKKKTKLKGIIIRTIFKTNRKDGSFIFFIKNSAVLLKKRLTPKGKTIKGPVNRIVRRKKFISSFKKSV